MPQVGRCPFPDRFQVSPTDIGERCCWRDGVRRGSSERKAELRSVQLKWLAHRCSPHLRFGRVGVHSQAPSLDRYSRSDLERHHTTVNCEPEHREHVLSGLQPWVALDAHQGCSLQRLTAVAVAATEDGGKTWSLHQVSIPLDLSAYAGRSFSFADDTNGGLMVGIAGGSGSSRARPLATSDGGKTWTALSQELPVRGEMQWLSQSTGWLRRYRGHGAVPDPRWRRNVGAANGRAAGWG